MLSTYIPGDCLPGLLDGWCGPKECRSQRYVSEQHPDGFDTEWHEVAHPLWPAGVASCPTRLDLRREEVCDRVARVLARILGVPVGATAPRFIVTPHNIGCLGDYTETASSDADPVVWFSPHGTIGIHAPNLGAIPLDSPDRDALALAEIARWVGAEIRAGRITP